MRCLWMRGLQAKRMECRSYKKIQTYAMDVLDAGYTCAYYAYILNTHTHTQGLKCLFLTIVTKAANALGICNIIGTASNHVNPALL